MPFSRRLITKGAKVGPCNICGVTSHLTEDHIPPKGVSRLSQIAMMNIVDLLSGQRPNKSTRFLQDGVKYRTLCRKCNNELLGTAYDPILINLSNEVRTCLTSTLHLPALMKFKTKPNRLARCIVGHLLAHGVDEHRNGIAINQLTDYFLNSKDLFPSNLKMYYWIYPYNDQVVIKGSSLSVHHWNSFAVFMLLKCFPISFFIVIDEPKEWNLPYGRLDHMLNDNIDDERDLYIDLKNFPPQRWPEAPSKSGMVIHGDGSTAAIPRN